MDIVWCEIDAKSWDRLSESQREIFISGNGVTSLAGRADILEQYGITPIRNINTFNNQYNPITHKWS